MEIIRKILPYLFVLFFIVKGNKKSLYFLGIPFLMYMSKSIFFENAKLFNIPGRLGAQLGFIWLVPLWILSKTTSTNKLKKETGGNRLNIIDYLIIGLIILSIIGLVTTVVNYYPIIKGILWEFLTYVSLFLAYFIIKDWVSSNRPEVVINFLFSLVIINSIASFLFILHQGLHLNIYVGEEYMSESFQGQEITRSFWFMPQFLPFSIAFLLVFTKKYAFGTIALLLVNLLAVIITYTISSVIIAIIILFLYFILVGLKNGTLGLAFKNVIIYLIIGALGIFIMSKLLPANTNYLLFRISEHTESQYTLKEPDDMDVRFANTAIMISKMDPNKKMLGMGPVTEAQSPKVIEMTQNTADSARSGVVFDLGFIWI
jgi:hypothetical protein